MERIGWFEKRNIILARYEMPIIASNMYILYSKYDSELIIVDPHFSKKAQELLDSIVFEKIIVLTTHEHYDHISGVRWLREKYDIKVTVICTKHCKDNMENATSNFSKFWDIIVMGFNGTLEQGSHYNIDYDYTCSADVFFEEEYLLSWNKCSLKMISAPGHSLGGMLIDIDGEVLFTGDNLTNGNGVIYRWPGGSKKDYLEIIKPMISMYNDDTIIMPGHGEIDILGNIKQYLEFYKKSDAK